MIFLIVNINQFAGYLTLYPNHVNNEFHVLHFPEVGFIILACTLSGLFLLYNHRVIGNVNLKTDPLPIPSLSAHIFPL